MSELHPKQIKHFIDKTPEELIESLQAQATEALHTLLNSVKEQLITYPTSKSLTGLQQSVLDELISRERAVNRVQLEELGELEAELESLTALAVLDAAALAEREFPDNKWIIDRIIPDAGFVMFVGEAGAGKSFIALDAIRAILTQTPFLDHFEVNTKCKILIIDKENGLRRLKTRMQGLNIPMTDEVFLLEYPAQFKLSDTKFINQVSAFIKEKDIKLIILDSFIDIIQGNENDSGDTNEVFDALRLMSSEVAYFILHHDAKPIPKFQKSAGQKTRGSSNILAQLDNQFYLEKTKNLKVITVEQGKARDEEPVTKFQIEFQSSDNNQMTGFKYLGEVQDEASKVDEASEFIQKYLTDNPNSSRLDIIDGAQSQNISPRSIDRAKKMLEEKSVVDSYKDGHKKLYFINESEDSQAQN